MRAVHCPAPPPNNNRACSPARVAVGGRSKASLPWAPPCRPVWCVQVYGCPKRVPFRSSTQLSVIGLVHIVTSTREVSREGGRGVPPTRAGPTPHCVPIHRTYVPSLMQHDGWVYSLGTSVWPCCNALRAAQPCCCA